MEDKGGHAGRDTDDQCHGDVGSNGKVLRGIEHSIRPGARCTETASVALQRAVNLPAIGSPLIDSRDAFARALQDYFLANADRGDDAANDELIAELTRWIRARQASDGPH